ncbi:MAG TPA: DUF5343 domain-containing protein [Xanthobacteraceae bacterium]|nr:DUF5343 domain-containing protein [Xanthobacteraceae bacterium]
MALPDVYVQVYGQFPEVFKRISDGQAPDKFTRQYLKDLGFRSSNHHALIPLFKTLGFLSADGVPTTRYHAYRDKSQASKVMGQALREAYADLFTIKEQPTEADRPLIEGKFKSAHNTSDRVAKLMASTFYSLLPLADLKSNLTPPGDLKAPPELKPETAPDRSDRHTTTTHRPTLHYNIQIHLPSTKDVEVFNAIFKSLREHLLD